MKQGWEIKKLEAVTKRIFAGGDKPKNFSETITDTLKIPVYANGVCDNGLCGYTDTSIVTDNCITVSARGTIGFCCIRKEPFVPIVRLIVIIPNDNIVVKYLYYAIKHSKIDNSGTSIPQLTVPMIRNISIPVPSLAEQERIVEILDREFERIDALKANAEQNLQHAKDLFQSALKQELQPKEGWTVKHLEKISTFSQGVQVEIGKQSTEKQDGYMRFLRIVDFTKGNEPPRYVGITDEKYQVKSDSLSVVRYGASAGFICTGLEGVIANNIFRIVPKKDILIGNTYLYYVLISDIFQSVIRDSVNGAAMPAISFGMIKNIDIPYPSIDEQQSIVVRLDRLREHCKALEENYTKTIALCDDMKQALLRKAFNGEL